jgi:hypothetical protein
MKKLFILLFVIFQASLMAQTDTTKYWKFSGLTSLNLNQISLTNWTPGGISSISISAVAKLYANYKKDKISWNNNLNMQYGMQQNQGEKLRKNEDQIDFTSVIGYDIAKKWAFTGLVNFQSQFANGWDKDNDSVLVSKFMSPGYLTISPAFRYMPVEWFSLYLSPATVKMTFVLDQDLANIGYYGVKPGEQDSTGKWIKEGKNVLVYMGPYVQAYLKKTLAKGLDFESRLTILYTLINRENLEPIDMDINWENFLNYKLTKYFAASLTLNLVYYPGQPTMKIENGAPDKAVPNRSFQIKETFGIGLSYTFPNTK